MIIMKRTIQYWSAAILLATATFRADAEIIAGPITNPANGHDYYLLTPDSWTASEAAAEELGGTLAIVRNADEQRWLQSTFSAYGDTNRNLWIGLRRVGPNAFAWVTDAKVEYSNWEAGQPDNAGGVESYVHFLGGVPGRIAGTWNDLANAGGVDGLPTCGIAEVPGKSKIKSLSGKAKELVGTWYEHGDPDRPCWIAGTENTLFAIDHSRNTSRAVLTAEGFLFASHWQQHAEITSDRIFWSRGGWWSRKPVEYRSTRGVSDDTGERAQLRSGSVPSSRSKY
jgi:hypothetical protein